jgi:hypothetical protein
MRHVVEILHFAGCPNANGARRAVDAGIAQAALPSPVEVRIVEVVDEEDAHRLRFLGSPTVRVDGRDVDASSIGRDDFGLQCRVYSSGTRITGCPPPQWIASALRASEP